MRALHLFPFLLGFLVLVLLGVGDSAGTAPALGVISEELDTPSYDCLFTLQPTADADTLQVWLEEDGQGQGLRLRLTRQALVVDSISGTQETRIAKLAIACVPDHPFRCFVLRRGGWLALALAPGEAPVWRGEVARGVGARAVIIPGAGWRVDEARIQPLEPVVFADNFMRTKDESGGWRVQSGQWGLQSAWDADPRGGSDRFRNASYAQNPFAWSGRGSTTPAWCLTGHPFWEDYTVTTAVNPPADGAVGVGVNLAAPGSGLLVRWTPADDHRPGGDRLCLLRLVGGSPTELASDRGGYLPGQWYRLQVVSSLTWARVLVDGRERLAVENPTPWRGGVGLYVEGSRPAIFDDVTVYGRTLRTELIAERRQARFNERFQRDEAQMAEWAAAAREWQPFPTRPGDYRLHRWLFHGDAWLTLTVQPSAGPAGSCSLLLNGDGVATSRGYRALIERSGVGQPTYTLYRDTERLATATGARWRTGDEYLLRFQRSGHQVQLLVDGDVVVEAADPQPLAGNRVAYGAAGCLANVKDALALGRNVLDYSFDDAPVDWLAEGAWMPTTRWSCTPHWSYLGGWSRGEAVLWHKQRFTGDQSLQAYVAPKMEYPRERQTCEFRFRDFCLTICGDGRTPRSGYTGIYGAPDLTGRPSRRTVLLRDGVEVAAVTRPVITSSVGHTSWIDLTLHKRGAVVEFWVHGERILTYTDPAPLAGGVPAIWTSDNGLAVARARLAFAAPPVTRTEPQVLLDDPWSPEWMNVGAPLTLDFPRACSTTGAPVILRVTPHTPIASAAGTATVEDSRVIFTPRGAGDFWFQVAATDGTTRSPAFNLALRAFDPARGRDDSHAVALYRFTEGSGQTVRDQSTANPPIDLTFPAQAPARWLPGQGLQLTGPCALTSGRGVSRLAPALTKATAGTFEFWVSLETIFPPVDWAGCLLAWQHSNTRRNLAIANMREYLVLTRAATFTPRADTVTAFSSIRTGLQHLVITWNGTTTSCYVNGQLLGQAPYAWTPARWFHDAPLILGNVSAIPRCDPDETSRFLHNASYILKEQHGKDYSFLGTYYLVAIHDRCLPPAQVQRHYEVGPGAK